MPQTEKTVRYIAPKASVSEEVKNKYRQKRVAAYCRVSTQQEEQINSYEVQTRYYTEKINAEPKWKLVRSSSESLRTKVSPVPAPSTAMSSTR